MSEAMSSREIEDVLTSIRRLVAQDGGRPADRATETAVASGGRLILTESQRVDAANAKAAAEVDAATPTRATLAGATLPAPDFGRLEATIAELEAAVSASGGAWEGEAADEVPRASNVTELYGRVATPPRKDTEPVAAVEIAAVVAPAAEEPAPLEEVFELPQPPADTADEASQDEPEVEDAILDEAGLRALVAQIVREELQGQLGERITAQVRRLVRAEIAKALDDRHIL